ncbi:MAG: DUF421 domain-containing protein [Chthoniobacterales bacterium]|nr:DUF421 domain-containing protein [Chthoniobacterales bacterium]
MNSFLDSLRLLLGLDLQPKDLSFLQITLRGVIMFAVALVLARLSDRRSLTKKSPFDTVLLVLLASVMARGVNGSSAFFPTIGASAILVGLHRLLAFGCCRWPLMHRLFKGAPAVIVRGGNWQRKTLLANDVTEEDVLEDMRLRAKTDEVKKISVARLEAGGDISFIMAEGN